MGPRRLRAALPALVPPGASPAEPAPRLAGPSPGRRPDPAAWPAPARRWGRAVIEVMLLSAEYPPHEGGVGDYTACLARALAGAGAERRTQDAGEADLEAAPVACGHERRAEAGGAIRPARVSVLT